MKKVILEEIENMKYLLGYKRGVVISEQEVQPIVNQDNDNNLDPKVVVGTTPPAAGTTQPAAGTTQPVAGTPPPSTPSTPIKIGVKYPSIVELQNSLNTKFQSGLTPDGKYGPKTASSVLAALSKTSTTTPTNTTPVNTVVGGDASSEAIKKTAEANASTGVVAAPGAQNKEQSVNGNFSDIDSNEFTTA